MWSKEQLEQWRALQEAYLADASVVRRHKEIDQRRSAVQQELIPLLDSFLEGRLSFTDFNRLFQQKAYDTGNVFCLRGTSGGVFLNKLGKYVPDQGGLACRLRTVLRVPKEARDGQQRMQSFFRFLEELIARQTITRYQLQPSRIPFLLSAWWHLQDGTRWPIVYPLVDLALRQTGGQTAGLTNPIDHYFAFRTRFLALAKKLGISSWELEHLCTWYGQRYVGAVDLRTRAASVVALQPSKAVSRQEDVQRTPVPAAAVTSNTMATAEQGLALQQQRDTSCHTHVQWLLAKIGLKVGCRVWIAGNDHSKVWNHDRLGDLSVKALPILADSAFQHIVSRIDVLWFHNEEVAAAFEIEHTTEIYPGLLRLYDLGSLFPEHSIALCVVAPKKRLGRVQFELSRPSLYGQAMHEQCALICEEVLLHHEEHILRWASGPAVIEDLVSTVIADEE